MNKKANIVKKIIEHPDKDELISKLILDISPKDINEWLGAKYTNISEKKFVISETALSNFKDNYLDVYSLIQEDISKTKQAVKSNSEEDLTLAIQNNPTYKNKLMQLAGKEIDIRSMISTMCVAVETRLGQVFDLIQDDPRSVNTRIDRVLIEYCEVLGGLLEKYYKFTEAPADLTIQHNVTLQVVDQHISVFHDVIKDILSQLDLESSMLFMELFNEKMAKLKAPQPESMPNTDMKLAQVTLINETINKKLNQ